MDLFSLLVSKDVQDYKCFDILKSLLENNPEFKQIILSGFKEGKINSFNDELWDKIRNQNIRRINNFEDVFRDGANLGYCTVASKQLSFSLNNCFICGGILPILAGTNNCIDGSHTWIEHNNKIIDTSLMLIIDKEYVSKIGYIEENRYNPMLDDKYAAAKDFALDPELRKNQKK